LPSEQTTAIVGYGHVGRQTHRLFPNSVVHDLVPMADSVDRAAVNACTVAFVCVPTPALPSGAADLTAIEDVFGWLTSSLAVIRSTVPPGTTERIASARDRAAVVWPEFIGQWAQSRPTLLEVLGFPAALVGGLPSDRRTLVALLAPALGAETRIIQASARTVELAKYMENAWLAMQVVFVNEFFDLATELDIDYWELRELWLADPRIPRTHTVVQQSRGFSGRCLPKDLDALLSLARDSGVGVPLLESIRSSNRRWSQGRPT